MNAPDALNEALALRRAGRPAEAAAACRSLIESRPDHAGAWHVLGLAEGDQGHSEEAERALREAARLGDSDPRPVIALARLLGARARVDEALDLLDGLGPDATQAWMARGEILGAAGRGGEAVDAFRRARALDPASPVTAFNLGLAHAAAGAHREAAAALSDAVRLSPRLAPAWTQLGGVLNALGQYDGARQALENAVRLAPRDATAWTWLGAARQLAGDLREAEACYRQSVTLAPGHADAQCNLGRLLQANGQPREAETHLRRALEIAPGHPVAVAGLAVALDKQGRHAEGLAALDRELPDAGARHETAPIRARLLRKLGRGPEAVPMLEALLRRDDLPMEARVQVHFSLAALADAAGDAERAFALARDGNRLRRGDGGATSQQDRAAFRGAVDDLIRVFDPGFVAAMPRASVDASHVVLVVGMPRAGKSLVEQLLCSHPGIRGAGELTALPDIVTSLSAGGLPWPASARQLTAAGLTQAARHYLDALCPPGDGVARVIDTMPFNYLNLGLVGALLPGARVVHCVRDPRDLALRCYFKNFAGRSLGYTTELGDIAAYYRDYRRLMDHWERMPDLSLTNVEYERLVADPEATARSLLAFLSLDWDDACREYYRPGVATSASDTTLTEPLDTREVGGWRRYAAWLTPLGDLLGDDTDGR